MPWSSYIDVSFMPHFLLCRLERDRQLVEKIKQHTQRVQERKTRPKGNPLEEMEAAKRDLELVNIVLFHFYEMKIPEVTFNWYISTCSFSWKVISFEWWLDVWRNSGFTTLVVLSVVASEGEGGRQSGQQLPLPWAVCQLNHGEMV